MTKVQFDKFMSLRSRAFAMIKSMLDEDGHCKSYEGTFTVKTVYPNYFEKSDVPVFEIHMACYLLSRDRQECWDGSTFQDALDSFEEWVIEKEKGFATGSEPVEK